MSVTSLSLIVLRVFALHLFISGAVNLPVTLYYISMYAEEGWLNNFLWLAPQLGMVLSGTVIWKMAPMLSKSFSRETDEPVSLESITEQQLYRIALVCLGLFLSLSTFAKVLIKLHDVLVVEGLENSISDTSSLQLNYYAEPFITFVVGIVLVATSRQWSAKLCKKKS